MGEGRAVEGERVHHGGVAGPQLRRGRGQLGVEVVRAGWARVLRRVERPAVAVLVFDAVGGRSAV